jgi:hypothetical protein
MDRSVTVRLTVFWTLLFLFLGVVTSTLVRAEQPIIIQRTIIVPPGAVLNYLVNGEVVQHMDLPVGTASITLRFEPHTDSVGNPLDLRGKIVNRHGRIIRRRTP